jgi:hypothetical protein
MPFLFLSVKAQSLCTTFKENGHFYDSGYIKTLSCTIHSVPLYPYCHVHYKHRGTITPPQPSSPFLPFYIMPTGGSIHRIVMKSEEFKKIKICDD